MTAAQVEKAAAPLLKFSDNFWETVDKNGIAILIERMRGAKQTCERYKHAYEARALLEEEYGRTLLQIAQKQKSSSLENGSSKAAMDTMQAQFQSVAESHIHLSNLLRENVAGPLTKLSNKQRMLRKELQTSIQKLYNNRQVQAHFVRRAHKRHNLEIEKANLLVQQQTSEKDKRATFKSAEITIDKLKKVYNEALNDLTKIVDDWNTEWKNTCESFEKLEQERLEFFKSNLSNCANLMVGCLEGEIQACEKINAQATKIDVAQDLVEFVKKNKSSNIVPTPMEYIKLHAYHEANQDNRGGDLKFTHDEGHLEAAEDPVDVNLHRSKSSTVSTVIVSEAIKPTVVEEEEGKIPPQQVSINVVANRVTANEIAAALDSTDTTTKSDEAAQQPVLLIGVMEVYASGDEDSDSDEYEYVTDTESDGGEQEDGVVVKADSIVQSQEIAVKSENNSSDLKKQEEEAVIQVKDNIRDEEEQTQIVDIAHQTSALANITQQPKEMLSSSPPTTQQQTDIKVDRLMSAYHKEIQQKGKTYNPQQQQPSLLASKSTGYFNPKQRRVSFVESNPIHPEPSQATIIQNELPPHQNDNNISKSSVKVTASPSNILLERLHASPHSKHDMEELQQEGNYPHNAEDAAMELDDMLRELDSKRIIREEEDSVVRYHGGRRQIDVKPTTSMSSPTLQDRRSGGGRPNSYYTPPNQQQQQQQKHSKRMSTVETYSHRQSSYNTMGSSSSSSHVNIYDPFNSLSSKNGDNSSTFNSDLSTSHHNNKVSNNDSPPSVQMIHERMLQQNNISQQDQQLKQRQNARLDSTLATASLSSMKSAEQQTGSYRGNNNNKFIQDFYSIGSSSKTPSPDNSVHQSLTAVTTGGFIDFAFALYDYQEADEGEISFKEGDLLGIISKSEEEDEQGWWEASLLNRRNQKVVKTGLVPSNFLETASR